MSLAQVQAIVALFVEIMISLTCLLTVVAILLPGQSERAKCSLQETPRRCFIVGIGMVFLFIFGLVALNLPNPLLKLFAFLLITGITGVLTVGGAGMAQLMGNRISEMSGTKTSFGAMVSGSVAYSVAVFFPYIGWFVLAPLSILFALGAGTMALLPASSHRTVALPQNAWQPLYAGGATLPMNVTPAQQATPLQFDPQTYTTSSTPAPLPLMNAPREDER